MSNVSGQKFTTLPLWYIPSLNYIWKLAQCSLCVFADHLQYNKKSPVSISAPLGEDNHRITLPVRHDGKRLPISEKLIDNSIDWAAKHYKTMYHIYHQFPYGYYYLPKIKEILERQNTNLSDYLFLWIEKMIGWMHLSVKVHRSSELNYPGNDTDLIINISENYKKNIYVNENEVYERGWINKHTLEQKKIIIRNFVEFPEANIFAAHRHMTILTFLMRFGPEAGFLIKQFQPIGDKLQNR
ncbi:MAG: WbqC family protein [Calditrichaceae bacterium]|nr:WbqC family protein [Calditrichaceae bacterium]MBN2709361.1 WbqC family protein [Calditrichaceae bacterium]